MPPHKDAANFEQAERAVKEAGAKAAGAGANGAADLERLKAVLSEHNITLKFSQDADTKAIVVEMVDGQTGEAIRQIPSTLSLKLAAHFVKLQGQFIDENE